VPIGETRFGDRSANPRTAIHGGVAQRTRECGSAVFLEIKERAGGGVANFGSRIVEGFVDSAKSLFAVVVSERAHGHGSVFVITAVE